MARMEGCIYPAVGVMELLTVRPAPPRPAPAVADPLSIGPSHAGKGQRAWAWLWWGHRAHRAQHRPTAVMVTNDVFPRSETAAAQRSAAGGPARQSGRGPRRERGFASFMWRPRCARCRTTCRSPRTGSALRDTADPVQRWQCGDVPPADSACPPVKPQVQQREESSATAGASAALPANNNKEKRNRKKIKINASREE